MGTPILLNITEMIRAAAGRGPAWKQETEDLDVNLLVFGHGEGIEEHVNQEVDVLLVGIEGAGTLTVDGVPRPILPGTLAIIPKGARRSIRSTAERLAYVSCHRRRRKLTPRLRTESR